MKFAVISLCLGLAFAQVGFAQTDTPALPARAAASEVALFNGKDFTGLTFCAKPGVDPLKTWSVTNGVIHCTGKPGGYLRTTGIYSNYFLTVVWRFVKVAPGADNGGVLVHIQSPDKIWPQCIQVQGKHNHQGDLFLMEGAESKEHLGLDKNTPLPMHGPSAENPVGEWTKVEIICLHNKVETFVNGKFMNETSECTINSGYIGLQSEGGEMEIKSISYSPLKY